MSPLPKDKRPGPLARAVWRVGVILLLLLVVHRSAAAAAIPDDPAPGLVSSVDSVTWSGFAPTAWVSTTPFSTSVTALSTVGLVQGSDAYSVTSNGGVSWSAWSNTGLSTQIPVSTTHIISVSNLTLPDSAFLNYIRYRVMETGGGEVISDVYLLLVDTAAPGPPTHFSGFPARQWTNVNRFSEAWQNPTDTSGIVGAFYKLDALPTSGTDGQLVNTVNTIADIRVPSDGKHDIYVWLLDAAGNIGHAALSSDADVFWYDGTRPVSTFMVTPPLPATLWYTGSVSISLAATDLPVDAAYPPFVEYQLDASPWGTAPSTLVVSTEGEHWLDYRARDKAGNLEAAKEFDFGIDRTAPTVAWQADRLPNASGWYTAAVTYTLSVADSGSGSPQGFYRINSGAWQQGPVGRPAVIPHSANGTVRIDYYGQDAAGNRSSQSSVVSRVDATRPTIDLAIDGVQGENGWHVSNVTCQLLPLDSGSGVETTQYQINGGAWQTGPQFTLSGDGIYELAYYATDVAGNTSEIVTGQVNIDTAAPAGPLGLTAFPTTWSHTNSFDLTWTSPSGTSGVTGSYVKLGDLSGGGAPTGPRDGTATTQTEHIDGLAVPAEGAYRVYLWLRDAAGNADHTTAPADGPVLRYDATPPNTTVAVQGTAGQGGWWLSPIEVTLTSTESASGFVALRYRVDGATWQTTTRPTATLRIDQPDKHVIEYYAEDVAGNLEPIKQYTVRLDLTPPPAPTGMRVLPQGWTRFNSFQIEWNAVADPSGIAGAYVKFDAAPSSVTDGTFYGGSTLINNVTAPAEGRHTVYVWLRDGAGNADLNTVVVAADAVWYDGTAPTSLVTPSAALGSDGWYVGPVTFDISGTDTASGLRDFHYQVDSNPIQTVNTAPFPPDTTSATAQVVVSADGRHVVRIWAVDQVGNEEPAHTYELAIDQVPPMANFTSPTGPVTRTQFDISWSGSDHPGGSGLASYDVQVRDGYAGTWQNWLTDTPLTTVQFQAQRGHLYYFRVFGRDHAGGRQSTPGALKVFVQTVLNGGFDTGNFTDWSAGGQILSAVVPTTGPGNVSTLVAKLGSEVYGPSLTPPGNVPAGCAALSQALTIPSLQQLHRPRLRFWYRVLTYDVIYSERLQSFVDTLDVKLLDEQGQQLALLLRSGNPTSNYGTLYDTGWKLADLDLRPYAGRNGQLHFTNCNGPQNGQPDNLLNTWSYVDGVEIYDGSFTYLPIIERYTSASPSAVETGEIGADGSVPSTVEVGEIGADKFAPATVEETTEPVTPGEVEPVR